MEFKINVNVNGEELDMLITEVDSMEQFFSSNAWPKIMEWTTGYYKDKFAAKSAEDPKEGITIVSA